MILRDAAGRNRHLRRADPVRLIFIGPGRPGGLMRRHKGCYGTPRFGHPWGPSDWLHLVVLREVGRGDVTGISIEDRLGALLGPGDQPGADLVSLDVEGELAAGQIGDRQADDGHEVVRLVDAPVSEGRDLSSVRIVGSDPNQVVLGTPILREGVPLNAPGLRLHDPSVTVHDQSGVIPVGIFPIRTVESQPLPEPNELRYEPLTVGQNEITGTG